MNDLPIVSYCGLSAGAVIALAFYLLSTIRYDEVNCCQPRAQKSQPSNNERSPLLLRPAELSYAGLATTRPHVQYKSKPLPNSRWPSVKADLWLRQRPTALNLNRRPKLANRTSTCVGEYHAKIWVQLSAERKHTKVNITTWKSWDSNMTTLPNINIKKIWR